MTDKAPLIPFYLVVDVSQSMTVDARIEHANRIVGELVVAFEGNPILSDKVRVALIDFSDVKHNTMPEPDRTKDNSTYWTPDFSVQHYKDMLFTPGGGPFTTPTRSGPLSGRCRLVRG